MDDKTVIMTFTNEAWAAPGSLQDLFLSFRLGIRTAPLLKHLIIIAVDTKAYKQCQRAHSLCYHLRVEEDGAVYTAEQAYMSKGYLEMMWRRNRFQVQGPSARLQLRRHRYRHHLVAEPAVAHPNWCRHRHVMRPLPR